MLLRRYRLLTRIGGAVNVVNVVVYPAWIRLTGAGTLNLFLFLFLFLFLGLVAGSGAAMLFNSAISKRAVFAERGLPS